MRLSEIEKGWEKNKVRLRLGGRNYIKEAKWKEE